MDEINDRKPSVPHEIRRDGSWACSAIGMKMYARKSTIGGYAVCGHCMAYVRDEAGNKLPYTLKDCFRDHNS